MTTNVELTHVGELQVMNVNRNSPILARVLASDAGVHVSLQGVGNIRLSPSLALALQLLIRKASAQHHQLVAAKQADERHRTE